MKTLVVLSALVAVALAAPTGTEQGSGDFKKTFVHNKAEIFKREKKSTIEGSNVETPALTSTVHQPSTSQIAEFGVSGRSFGLKKPIIIKKKPMGYQVYRDSDEVPVDSEETCGSHVKVKFCDGKAKMKSSTVEDSTQFAEEELKHSITMAKEALDNIHRDLSIVERKPGSEGSSWNHGHSESDVELHQDIEVAREALEQIHKNFGNLETMSLKTTTLKNVDSTPDTAFTMGKTEEQRLAQWQKAMDIIQRNVEIARNIEDSFREAPMDTRLFSDMTADNQKDLNKLEHKVRSDEEMTKVESKSEADSCKTSSAHMKSSENLSKEGLTEDDMTSSATTMSEKKPEDLVHVEEKNAATELLSENVEKTPETLLKESGDDTMTMQDLIPTKTMVSDSMKLAEDIEEGKEKTLSSTQNAESLTAILPEMKSVETEDMLMEEQKAAEPTKQLEKLEIEKDHLPELKSSEILDKKIEDDTHADLITGPSEIVETTLFAKSAEEVSDTQQEPLEDMSETTEHNGEARFANEEDVKQEHEMIAPLTNAEQTQFHHHQQHFFHPEMKAVEDVQTMQQQQLIHPEARWAHENHMQLQREPLPSTEGIRSQSIDHVHTVQHPGHHHHIAHSMKNHHHFEIPNGHEHLHSRFPNNFAMQAKSADPEMQMYYMRDGSGVVPETQFRWKPTHEARTAYGAPASPAAASQTSGAVGVFPNANVGGCGIPLLLSCNPSVVSGSLAKPAPSAYPAPAYRTEDDFTFHTKRDVKKPHDTLHRLPKHSMKTGNVLVAKQ